MTYRYRIRVGEVDASDDIPVMLEERLWVLPFWVRIYRTWVYSVSGKSQEKVENEIEEAKRRLRGLARKLTNPKILPHVEVLSDV
jgi:hypothetical protein